MEIELTQTQFNGGIASDSKTGLQNAARFNRNLDIFTDADSVRLNPKPILDSATTVTDLIKCGVDTYPWETARYAYGDAGNLYKITSNTWSLDRTVSGGAGQGIGALGDLLLYAGSTKLGKKGILSSGAATYDDDFLTNGTDNVDVSQVASGNIYTVGTGVTETDVTKIISLTGTLVITKDPLKTVSVFIASKGSGNWTLALHDRFNNVIGTKTIANASLTDNAFNDFTFATPLRTNPGQSYHIHITSTVADGTVQTSTASDISTAQFKTIFGILIADTEFHGMIQHTNGVTGILVIANVDYMATYDLETYSPNAIRITPGYRIRGWTRENEFIVAFATKGVSIDDFEEGKLFYWDGIQPYYNYSKPVPDGQPNAIASTKNRLFSVLGSKGDMALGTEPFRALQSAPKLTTGKKVEVLPEAITTWQRRVHLGFSNTDDTLAGNYNYTTGAAVAGMEQGVYSFGSESDRAISLQSVSTEVLNFAFSPSTPIVNPNSFKIGWVEAFGKDLYISYKDGSTYYVDRVNKGNAPCANGSYESLIIDLGIKNKQLAPMPQKTKKAIKLVVTFEPLLASVGVTPKFRMDRTLNWTLGTAMTTLSETRAELSFENGDFSPRYREIEIGFDLAAASTNQVVVTSMLYVFDPLLDEVDES